MKQPTLGALCPPSPCTFLCYVFNWFRFILFVSFCFGRKPMKFHRTCKAPYTCFLKYLSPRVVSSAKTKVQNAPKPSKNAENHSKMAKNTPKSQNCPKTFENAQNGQNVKILFKPSRPVALPSARRRRDRSAATCSRGAAAAAKAANTQPAETGILWRRYYATCS